MKQPTKRFATWGGALAVLVGAAALAATTFGAAEGTGPEITVYKTPTCNCCTAWADHLRDDGFVVDAVESEDLARIKAEHGVPRPLGSCHTAVVDGYVIEGHVPADVIRQFLNDPPDDAAGLAVPGMPIGSPGMELPGRPAESYDVFVFDDEGDASIYASR